MATEGTEVVTADEPSPGYVYMVRDPNSHMVKIGRSVNPLARLLQIAPRRSGLELVSYIATADNVWLEGFMHEAFAHCRVRGEWFMPTVDEVKLFTSIVEADDIDALPSQIVAQRVLNEANGFQWGKMDKTANPPSHGKRMVGIPTPLANALEAWAASRFSDLTTEVRAAVRDYMKQNGIELPSAVR